MSGVLLAAWMGLMWLAGGGEAGAGPAPAPCTCEAAKEENGWCEGHAVGYVGSVEIRSRRLYDVLDAHGHTLDLDTFQCDACKSAIASDGFCTEHKVGFVGRQVYFSRLTYELARGETKDPAGITCPVCRKNAESAGWCERCGVGMVGRVAMKHREGYEQATKAIDVLRAAIRTVPRCEACAVAIVTDTQCPFCRITYKDGASLPPAPAP